MLYKNVVLLDLFLYSTFTKLFVKAIKKPPFQTGVSFIAL